MTVTKTADTNDGVCNADCSLREAITASNISSTVDVINFNIAGGGVKTITLGSQLPTIDEPVTIDGSTQPGYAGAPLIELNGNNVVATGLFFRNSTLVRALVLNRFTGETMGTGITSVGIPNVTIVGCYIGTNASGTAALGNALNGIVVYNPAGSVTIGGTGVNDRNIISGNGQNGIRINGCQVLSAATVSIKNNYIGTDVTGSFDLGNTGSGILNECGSTTTIGGTTAAERNVISGNNDHGIITTDGDVTMQGNYIGTNAAGTTDLGNSQNGIYVTGSGTTIIGGTSSGAGNVISGNNENGIRFNIQIGLTIQGNKIGTNAAGTAGLGNTSNGIYLSSSWNNNIGGTSSGAGNLVSGNGDNGIKIEGLQSENNIIKGNRIGVSNDSLSKIPNTNSGIFIAAPNTTIGEAGVAAARNVISGNFGNGIWLNGTDAHDNVIENNFIGTNSNGTNLNNANNGILITAGAHYNLIGGNNTATNTIAFNSLDGVNVNGATSLDNRISANAIYSNSDLGIDLVGTNGVTPNDAGDADAGANNLQNFPVIQLAFPNRIIGNLNSQANKTYTVEFYRNTTCDSTGFGEGQFYLGSTTVITNGSGNAAIDAGVSLSAGQILSATATDENGSTSEFSQCFTATAAPGFLSFGTANYSVNENGATATISVNRGFGSAGAIAVSYAASNGTATAGQDYTATSGTLNWANGDTASKTFTIPITNDLLDEPNETVNLTLSNPTNGAELLTSSAVLTIADDDNPPTISVNDVSKLEGNQGTTNFTFNITLSAVSGQTVAVDYTTANGTATAGIDYTFNGDPIVFVPGQTSKPITIVANGDTLAELDETFFINLQDPQNATFGDSQGTGTIQDDDNAGKLQFALSSSNVSENAGTATILVSRTNGTAGTVSVDYATSNGTATAGVDYTAASGTLVFLDGQTSASFNVPILQDNLGEANETVFLTLSNPNGGAVLGNPSNRTLTIIDDDGGLPANVSIGGKITENNADLPNVLVTLTGSQTKTALTDSHGNYNFANLPSGGNYLVTPNLAGHNFEPFNLSFNNVSSDVTNANFVGTTGTPSRILRVVSSDTVSGNSVVVPIELVAQGNENSIGFSLSYDSALLSNPQVSLGTDAPTAMLISNTAQAGQIGVTLALPSGQTFATGNRQVVTITFLTTQTALFSTPLAFTNQPTAKEIADANANVLPTAFVDGLVTFAQGYESDVAPRPTGSGNGSVTVADFTMVGKFVAGTLTPDQLNEFQRADSAPRGTKGNGFLTVSDYTQAGRYAAGLDTVQTAGGASVANLFDDYEKLEKTKVKNLTVPRTIRVVNAQTSPGQQVFVSIEIDSNGDENGFGFSLNYDANKLSNPLVTLGNGAIGATLIPNTNTAGKVGVVVAFPTGQTVQSGTKQLVTIRFNVAANAQGGQTALTFGNVPVFKEVVDVNADVLATDFTDGAVNILGPTAATVTVGGKIVDANGNAIAKTIISMTDINGATRTALSNSFGYYSFTEVPVGETYVFEIHSKRYTFSSPTQVRTIVEEISDVNFTANN